MAAMTWRMANAADRREHRERKAHHGTQYTTGPTPELMRSDQQRNNKHNGNNSIRRRPSPLLAIANPWAVVVMSALLRTTLLRVVVGGGIVRLAAHVFGGAGTNASMGRAGGGSYGRSYLLESRLLEGYLPAAQTTRSRQGRIFGTDSQIGGSSPVASMLSDFPNGAIEREMRRHDRYVVDGLAFVNTIKGFKVSGGASTTNGTGSAKVKAPSGRPYTLVILTRNRAVPYLAVLVAMLLRGHEPREFRLLLDIHVVNVERRREKKESYHLFDAMERKFAQLIAFHRWTDPYPELGDVPSNDDSKGRRKWFDANERLDYIRSLELCQSAQSKWCLVLQDDALPVDNLVGNLQHYVDRQTYKVKDANRTEEVALENVGMIKLFSAYNCGETDSNNNNERTLLRKDYAETQYHADIEQAKIRKFAHRFSTTPPCGTVAEAFPSAALAKVVSYLKSQEGRVDKLLQTFGTEGLDNNLTVLEMSQSMVNHIGFASEGSGEDYSDGISTDVRFSLTRGVDLTTSTGKTSRTFSISGMQGIFDVNSAIVREIQKHDRYLVDSLVYWDRFDETEAARYGTARDESAAAQITLVVMTVNRYIPYLSVFLGTLIRGHPPNDFAKFDLHVVNIERRLGKQNYTLFDDFKEKLGSFVTFHEWTDLYEGSAGVADSTKHYYADQRFDYIRSLKLCQSNNSTYCLIFEDDALPCVGFLDKFRRYVDVDEYQVDSRAVSRDKVGVLKLYNAWNDPIYRTSLFQDYGVKQYPKERALDIFETKAAGQTMEEVQHSIAKSRRSYGVVAEAYHSSVMPKLIDYLEAAGTGTFPVDSLINKKFIEDTGLERLVVDPAMINHIGYMSEHVNDAQINTQRISTDVRFQLDDGSYWKKKAGQD